MSEESTAAIDEANLAAEARPAPPPLQAHMNANLPDDVEAQLDELRTSFNQHIVECVKRLPDIAKEYAAAIPRGITTAQMSLLQQQKADLRSRLAAGQTEVKARIDMAQKLHLIDDATAQAHLTMLKEALDV